MKTQTVANLKGAAKDLQKSLVNTMLVLDQERVNLDPEGQDYRELWEYSQTLSGWLDNVQAVRREILEDELDDTNAPLTDVANIKEHDHSDTPEPEGYWQGMDF